MNKSNDAESKALGTALVEISSLASDLVWALSWLNSLVDALNAMQYDRNGDEQHCRSREFLEELMQRRATSATLNSAAREAEL